MATLLVLVDQSKQSDEICDLPGYTMEYPNVKVEGTYGMKLLPNGPKQSPYGTCSIYCKQDKNLYFRDDDGREKELTANDLAAPVNVRGRCQDTSLFASTTASVFQEDLWCGAQALPLLASL